MTTRVLLVAAVLLTLYSIIVQAIYGDEASISITIYKLSVDYPIISFLLGLLIGHWLWPLGRE